MSPRPTLADVDFDRAPFVVIWETTQACDLACRHCRACADPERDPVWQTVWANRPAVKNGRFALPPGPGFGIDENMSTLGEHLVLPPFLEPQRKAIVANLEKLD